MTEEEQKALLESQQAQSPSGSAFDAGMKDSLVESLMTMLPSVIGYAAGGQGGAAIGSKVGLDINQDMAMRRANRLTAQQNEAIRLAKQDTEKKELGLKERQTVVAEKRAKADADIERQKLAQNQKKLEMENAEALAKASAGPKPHILTTEQSKGLADLNASEQQLDALEGAIIQNAGSMGPIAGRLAALNPYGTEAKAFDAQMKLAAQNIGKSLEGGKLTDGDIARYREMLPDLKDTPEVASAKLAGVKTLLRQRKSAELGTLRKSGYDVSHFGEEDPAGIAAQPMKRPGGSALPNFGGKEAHAGSPAEPDWASMSEADLKKFLGQ